MLKVCRALVRGRLLVPATFALSLVIIGGAVDTSWADDILPKPFPASRYEKMGARSPFSPPTVAAFVPTAPVAATVSWSDKLAVTALMEQGGKYFATMVDRDTSQHFLISSDKENIDHEKMMLSSVQWAAKINQTRVTIRKGTEFGQVAFDPGAATNTGFPGIPGALPPRALTGAPQLPGNRPFNPPPGSNAGAHIPQAASAIVRRGPINATPVAPAAPVEPVAVRPAINRPVAKTPGEDDDDDDDQ